MRNRFPRRLRGTLAVGVILAAAVTAGLGTRAAAVSFRPDVLASLRADGSLQAKVDAIQDARERGLDQPPASAAAWLRDLGGDRLIPDRAAIVILVDFSDNPADPQTYPAAHYEAMLFSEGTYPTGSMRDWYLENSYGQFQVTGQVTLWLRMPQTYAYYVDGQAGFGNYPRNAQKLAEDAVVAADPFVDFSQFDNDGPDGIPSSGDDDGYVDALFVVHAGPGRETTGSDNDIHSHAWAMSQPQNVDGVTAYGYSMEPEDGKRGVFGHEFGHVLGLPDLYDTDYSSSGVGDWCMMSFGSWGGGGETPVHFLSWCKAQLGFVEFEEPRVNLAEANLPRVEDNAVAYALWTGGYPGQQYFTVENRQRVLSDVSLPGHGLVICHIDETASGNSNESHPLVAIEQADGLFELESGGGSDAGDPWPGSTNHRAFDDTSVPSTRDYGNQPTQVAVTGISDSGNLMSAALQVENAPNLVLEGFAIAEVSGNGDGDIDPGETWDMPVTVYNRGFDAQDAAGTLSTTAQGVTIVTANSSYGTIPAEDAVTGIPAFRATLGAGATEDGLPFSVSIQYTPFGLVNIPLVIGVNDSLGVFQWEHYAASPGFVDQWHLSTQRNHTPGGSYSWKCGAQGVGNYANSMDAALVTISLPLASVHAVRFWHWMDAEVGGGNTAWDGGVVEVSVDGGAWMPITPDAGYPYEIIANPASPFPGGTPCWSGSFDWREDRISLSGLEGTSVEIRFRFGTDGAAVEEGWYVDDVSIEGALPTALGDPAFAGTLRLAPPRPNPARESVALEFVQPAQAPARLTVVTPDGRRLMEWSWPASDGASFRQVAWDGVMPGGGKVPSGVYFVRLHSDGRQTVERMLWIR